MHTVPVTFTGTMFYIKNMQRIHSDCSTMPSHLTQQEFDGEVERSLLRGGREKQDPMNLSIGGFNLRGKEGVVKIHVSQNEQNRSSDSLDIVDRSLSKTPITRSCVQFLPDTSSPKI